MKDGKEIATNIIKALVKKLTTMGDTFGLKNENYRLKEDLMELKRKDET